MAIALACGQNDLTLTVGQLHVDKCVPFGDFDRLDSSLAGMGIERKRLFTDFPPRAVAKIR
ncbi:MAG: hypothetical protein KatS3mg130_2161 [Candidatus Sumerlaea sp.]|nr:MAG: hypothetical protein KatS3mg130_2161 [Candidatus Sumerlaea sp.]